MRNLPDEFTCRMRNFLAPIPTHNETSPSSSAGLQGIFTHWELRSFIILSLSMQIVLTLWTYKRKGISSQPVKRIFWLTLFLAADFSATVCLGGIFHFNMKHDANDRYMISLWSPFILQHLGRHISITTFSLRENEFWFSHLMRFLYHELTAIFICILASSERQFHGTTALLFITGTFKLGERVWALKYGSMSEVKSSAFKKTDPGLSKDDTEPYVIASRMGQIGYIQLPIPQQIPPPLDQVGEVASQYEDVRSLCAAYKSFNKCKGIYTDSIDLSRNAIQRWDAMDVNEACYMARMMEMELSFAYDFFYTKSVFSHSIWGWIARFINITLVFCALVLFSRVGKEGFLWQDVGITYTLLALTLILEAMSFIESSLSNRTFVQVGFQDGQIWRVIEGSIRKSRSFFQRKCHRRIFQGKPALMGQFNLLSFCFKQHKTMSFIKSVMSFLELIELQNSYCYTTYISIDDDNAFKTDIFNGARERLTQDRREHPDTFDNITPLSSRVRNVVPQVYVKRGFEECLLVWHIATDICQRSTESPNHHLTNAKYLSNYMLYLLVVHPSMLSSSTSELKSYQNAYAAAIQLYNDIEIKYDNDETVCSALENMEITISMVPWKVRKGRNSLLLNAQRLATRLKEGTLRKRTPDDDPWKLLFDVWVDFLCYAAIKCRGKDHAEQLGSGGEFITYVWLFITHSRMGSLYQPYV